MKTSEILILLVLVFQVVVAAFIFTEDGRLFVKFLASSRQVSPEKNKVIAKINLYRERYGRYPQELEQIGLGKQYGSVILDYAATADRFEVCFHYFPYQGGMASCYDSHVREWQMR